MNGVHVTRLGRGPRVVFVHGSMGNGPETFEGQEPLAASYALELIDRRGFGRSPARPSGVDFERDADDLLAVLGEGAHLVGHSYGAVTSLVATGKRPAAVRSLTLIEPPAFGLAPDDPRVRRLVERIRPIFPAPAGMTPDAWRAAFLRALGFVVPETIELRPDEIADVRSSMTERFPAEARPDLDAIAAAGLPVLVVRGDWSESGAAREIGGPAFAAVAETIAARLGTGVEVVAGAAHNPQRSHADRFNTILGEFLAQAGAGA